MQYHYKHEFFDFLKQSLKTQSETIIRPNQ